MKTTFGLCLVSLAAVACGEPFPKPLTPSAAPGKGYDGCATLSDKARDRASATSAAGWTFAIAGAGVTAAGATVLPLDGTLSRDEKIVAGSLIAGGALLLVAAQGWFKRSDAASVLAGQTAAILGERDGGKLLPEDEVVARCNVALGAWEQSRTSSSEVAASLLEHKKQDASAAKLDSDAAKAKEETAREMEKTKQKQIDLKLKVLELRPALTPDQIDQITK